ncbi:MAG: phosphoribosylanthranilate isomerase [Candidatus Krumholzibacteria bacterium]|nr:phosphoribosylanthranilate isomerase [Candidatus Krumholzibacteria bacterium]MDH4337610.1 phosphoribosylanthranilate isomerase [Candidatus Krumholzibacteria bacterium]MDH5270412.1 phosphoribosylanthranilate isomerase [Candidatus Krumholzibacteria bacterium]MDH5627773.1 phosphoribosylanthranilate isomerase [Candidatus Krumholzibacteria bacterium]
MSRPRVKICGLTRPEDAALAVSLGADFAGVIFADSPRRIDTARAALIRAAVPSALLVGVFRDPSLDEVAEAVRAADLDLLQFHGQETPAFCDEALATTGRPIIKVFNSSRVPEVAQLAAYTTTSYFLFDTSKDDSVPPQARLHDVDAVRRMGFRVFLAGGLTPESVRAAVATAHPFAVDVCRGVESAPGIKDAAALERFMSEVRA